MSVKTYFEIRFDVYTRFRLASVTIIQPSSLLYPRQKPHRSTLFFSFFRPRVGEHEFKLQEMTYIDYFQPAEHFPSG